MQDNHTLDAWENECTRRLLADQKRKRICLERKHRQGISNLEYLRLTKQMTNLEQEEWRILDIHINRRRRMIGKPPIQIRCPINWVWFMRT